MNSNVRFNTPTNVRKKVGITMYHFYMPTKIIMAEDCIRNNAEQMKVFGHRAFIVTGANSA